MRSLPFTLLFSAFFLTSFFTSTLAQNGGIARMKELRTSIDPIRSFDLPEDAPRARIISIDFLERSNRKMKKVFKDDSRQEDFRRWKLDELTDRDMRSSKEVKMSARSPFGSSSSASLRNKNKNRNSESEENIGEFFPSKIRRSLKKF